MIDGAPYPEGSQMFQSHDKKLDGKLTNLLKASKELKVGQARTFFDVCSEFSAITIVGLGSIDDGISNLECLDEKKENIRIGISGEVRPLLVHDLYMYITVKLGCVTKIALLKTEINLFENQLQNKANVCQYDNLNGCDQCFLLGFRQMQNIAQKYCQKIVICSIKKKMCW